MIETTARPERRTSIRLDRLVNQTGADRTPAADSSEGPSWLRPPLVSDTGPPDRMEHPARSPDTVLPAADHPTAGEPPDEPTASRQLNVGWPTTRPPGAEPWWRRTASRLSERWLPDRTAGPRRWRLPVLAGGAVLVGVAVAVGLTLSGTKEPHEVPPALPAASVSEMRNTIVSASPDAGASIVISVVGRVSTPGLVTLPEGSRVADALKAAGNPIPGVPLGSLNLARRLTDGEQIYVGVPTPAGAEPPATPGAGQPGAARVDLNSAPMATLDTLPGVGPVTAQRIIDWRTEHGRFASVEQLREVEGIGPTRFARLKDLVVAG